tara:strand:- start:4445 stop:6034 length:1590 start_codon:yes stop_codon:yes gene_type:complete
MTTKSEMQAMLADAEANGRTERAAWIRDQLGMPPAAAPEPEQQAPEQQAPEAAPFREMNGIGDVLPILGETAMDAGKFLGATAMNVPKSAGDLAGGLWNAVTNPLDTAAAIGDTVLGGSQKYDDYLDEQGMSQYGLHRIPSLPGMAADKLGHDARPTADAFGGAMGERYGGISEIMNTIKTDPAGAALDAAGARGLVNPMAGAAMNPVAKVAEATTGVTQRIPKSVPESLLKSAMKVDRKHTKHKGKEDRIIRTALDEGIIPTPGGVEKLAKVKGGVLDEVDELISAAAATDTKVGVGTIIKGLDKLKNERGGSLISGGDDLATIEKFKQNILDNARRTGVNTLDGRELHTMKKELYRHADYNKDFTGRVHPMLDDIHKNMASTTRGEIEKMVPEVKEANARLGRLIELEEPLGAAQSRIGKRNTLGASELGGGVIGTGVGSMTGSPAAGVAAGILTTALTKPAITTRGARLLEWMRKPGYLNRQAKQFLSENPTANQSMVAAHLESLAPDSEGRKHYEEEAGRLSGAQ